MDHGGRREQDSESPVYCDVRHTSAAGDIIVCSAYIVS